MAAEGAGDDATGMDMMRDLVNDTVEDDLERRSGLPGLGGRPRLHPAWNERFHADARTASSSLALEARTEASPSVIPPAKTRD